jgi:hypothetical protein
VTQSRINLARAILRAGSYERAADLFNEMIVSEESLPDPLRANALCGKADAHMRGGNFDVLNELDDAIALNSKARNSDGLSIAYGLRARLFLARGDLASAKKDANLCETESDGSENLSGRGTSAWLQGEIQIAEGSATQAYESLLLASDYAERAHNNLLTSDVSESMSRIVVVPAE